jgi:hypothetical protein
VVWRGFLAIFAAIVRLKMEVGGRSSEVESRLEGG